MPLYKSQTITTILRDNTFLRVDEEAEGTMSKVLIDPEDPQLARDRSDFAASSIAKVFPHLRDGIWHVTSPKGMLAILDSGVILPSSRSRPFTFPQTGNSYGLERGYVCLFDFGVLDEPQYVDFYSRWSTFFFIHRPFTVAVELDRAALGDRLIPNARAHADVGYDKVWIPHVEAWHSGPIQLQTARSCILIAGQVDPRFVRIEIDDPQLRAVLQLPEPPIDAGLFQQ